MELTSPAGYVRQSVPGQPCNDSVVINVAEEIGTIGDFCPQGAIQKIQVHYCNVTVTVSHAEGKALPAYVMSAMMKEEISGERPMHSDQIKRSLQGVLTRFTLCVERYIFTVSPKRDTPLFLATPGWPSGMQEHATVTWVVSVPEKKEAHLMFVNLSQPKCHTDHTGIKVQQIGQLEEDYSRREDEEAESEITVPRSFNLNMSNCRPDRGRFSVITKITLQNSTSKKTVMVESMLQASSAHFSVEGGGGWIPLRLQPDVLGIINLRLCLQAVC